jgi:hypothetical protein
MYRIAACGDDARGLVGLAVADGVQPHRPARDDVERVDRFGLGVRDVERAGVDELGGAVERDRDAGRDAAVLGVAAAAVEEHARRRA